MSFQLTESELLQNQLLHTRFLDLLAQDDTVVYALTESTNSFGEFLFVTLSAHLPRIRYGMPVTAQPKVLSFWGLGYHEPRECWLTNVWRWHETQFFKPPQTSILKTEARSEIDAHRAMCLAEADVAAPPTARGLAYSFFAELSDEDGALTELEDLEAMGTDVEGLFDA